MYTQFCHACHRLIHTERTSHEREAGFHYNGNDNQISELESLMNFDLKLTHTDASDTMIYHSCTRNFAMLVTAWSIRSELAMNEKQGPTSTEMTTKSVKWSQSWMNFDLELTPTDGSDTMIFHSFTRNEWIMIGSQCTSMLLTLWSTAHFHAISPCLSPHDPYGAS